MSKHIKKESSKTAEEVALVRIGESQKPEDERICYDPMAIYFISQETLQLLQKNPNMQKEKEVIYRGVANSVVARVRYFDDFLEKCMGEGLEQMVILGAGYDTRAYRIEGIKENVKVFEVDHPGTQNVKIEKLKEILGYLPDHVKYVSVDFENESLGKDLFKNGYNPSKKTLFLMEGLTMYITRETVDEILSFIVKNSCKGSSVIFDYGCLPANFDKHPERDVAENLLNLMEESGESMKFGLVAGTLGKFLSTRGFSKIQDINSEDYKKAYFKGKNKDREVYSLMSFAHAVVE